jgi:hypothetical protein
MEDGVEQAHHENIAETRIAVKVCGGLPVRRATL